MFYHTDLIALDI